ncbi:MAG: hypothetical protein KAX19_02595 [Candidatus Brocadiae bacterium]|nr:hypothetical protein [Candidatus Brocadiia bacterium]
MVPRRPPGQARASGGTRTRLARLGRDENGNGRENERESESEGERESENESENENENENERENGNENGNEGESATAAPAPRWGRALARGLPRVTCGGARARVFSALTKRSASVTLAFENEFQ